MDANWGTTKARQNVNFMLFQICGKQPIDMEKQKQSIVAKSMAEVEFWSMVHVVNFMRLKSFL